MGNNFSDQYSFIDNNGPINHSFQFLDNNNNGFPSEKMIANFKPAKSGSKTGRNRDINSKFEMYKKNRQF